MLELFEQGRWEELEDRLRSALAADPTDARSAFRLANLLVFEHREEALEEALRWYDVAWAQRWPGAVCLNNKGVTLARVGRAGEARAAVASFKEALTEDRHCAPAAYNLGILLERLGDEGELRGMVAELGLAVGDVAPEGLIRQTFGDAVQGTWGRERPPIDGPLFLWQDDLASGFGFEPTPRGAEMDEGDRYFRDGRAHLEAGDWQAAIDAFAMAASLYPELGARIVPYRVRAQVELAMEFRRKARQLRAEGDLDGARSAARTSYSMAASVPDRAFADELLLSEIRSLGEELRLARPSLDLQDLQHLISLARQRVEAADARISADQADRSAGEVLHPPGAFGRGGDRPRPDVEARGGNGEEEEAAGGADGPAEGAEAHPEAGNGNGQAFPPESWEAEGGDDGRPRSAATSAGGGALAIGRYIRGLCRDAWGQQLRFLVGCGAYAEAELMLDFSEVQWFAQEDLPRWRLELFTAQAERLAAEATQAASEGDRGTATMLFHQAREAAMEAGDPHLADRLDKRLARLQQRPEDPQELRQIQEMLGRGEVLEVLRRATAKLAEDPEQTALRSHREAALHRLRVRIEEALAARQWEPARRLAAEGLVVVTDDEVLRRLAREARDGRLRELIGQGENALAERRLDEARQRCEEALAIDPAHRPALELRRRIELAEKVDPDAADEAFDAELVEFQQARAAARPREAFEHLLQLRELQPEVPETREAEAWTAEALVRLWRGELGREPTPDKRQKLEEELLRLLAACPGFQPAVELREELRRATDPHEEEKRRWSLERLAEAQGHLRERKPAQALEVLEAVAELGDPRLARDLQEASREALAQIHRRVERKAREEAIEPEEERELHELIRACRLWDPAQARALEELLVRQRRRPDRRRQADRDFEAIREALRKEPDPLRALRLLHRLVAARQGEGSALLAIRRRELQALRRSRWQSLGPFGRLRARLYEIRHGAAGLIEQVTEEQEDADGER